MSNSLKASTAGLAIVDKSRQRLDWTKASTARWWQDAHTSRATLRRFWQGDYLRYTTRSHSTRNFYRYLLSSWSRIYPLHISPYLT